MANQPADTGHSVKLGAIIPLGRIATNEVIARLHRHHGPIQGFKFAIGFQSHTGEVVGGLAAGRPCRLFDDGRTLEVTRLATDGTANLCSFMYARINRAAKNLGYLRVVTYTLPGELGASLRAAGFQLVDEAAGGGSWDRASRHREDKHPLEKKWRWEVRFK